MTSPASWNRALSPQAFIKKWSASKLKERAASHSHFIDLCHLLGEPTPSEADPDGEWFAFEKGAKKTGGGDGWADVWKRGCFAWEYKGKHSNLDAAFVQLQRYAIALENPPLLVVSDMDQIEIHTNFTNTVEVIHTIHLRDLATDEARRLLKCIFSDPEQLKPGVTRKKLTEDAASAFAELAKQLHERGNDSYKVAHFINKLVFCMFAEDIGILPPKLLTTLLQKAAGRPETFPKMAKTLFAAMKVGGTYGSEFIDWFNGGLFDDEEVLPLDSTDIERALTAAQLDWSAIEPSIFGTLFERGLDPTQRSRLGAHYTDAASIMRIVDPVVIAPLEKRWAAIKTEVGGLLQKSKKARTKQASARLYNAAKKSFQEFRANLVQLRVLDPACGSGNFLYLALIGLKDFELKVMLEAEAHFDMEPWFPMIDPQNVLGIDINPYAAELARLTIWIGQIQWMLRHGFEVSNRPVLKSLEQIQCTDALLDGSREVTWPQATCIIGNPPFLGNKKMISRLGDDYVRLLRAAYGGRVPGGADFVTFWFQKALDRVKESPSTRVGLVATNSIRGGDNRKILTAISESGEVFEAWDDEPWVLDGAAVRVSIVCFSGRSPTATKRLNGHVVQEIYPDLTARSESGAGIDLTAARPLRENTGIIYMGTTKVGAFDIPGEVARSWLKLPNPHRRPNRDVVRPWLNAMDVVRRPADRWVIDFGIEMTEEEAALYEVPFQHLSHHVKSLRTTNRRPVYAQYWWRFGEPRPALRRALSKLKRSIVTPAVAKHRLFTFCDAAIIPDHQLFVITRSDETTLGILQSRFHEAWALRTGTSLEDRPRYTPSTTFETFPFPEGLTPNIPSQHYVNDPRAVKIAAAATDLCNLRESWLNPVELVRSVKDGPGLPTRSIPVSKNAEAALSKRTLTNLYNQRPVWLSSAHAKLDRAVAEAYGWAANISNEEALERLLELNQQRTVTPTVPRKGPEKQTYASTSATRFRNSR